MKYKKKETHLNSLDIKIKKTNPHAPHPTCLSLTADPVAAEEKSGP